MEKNNEQGVHSENNLDIREKKLEETIYFNNQCRLCTKIISVGVPIFGDKLTENKLTNINTQIKCCLSLQIFKTDQLPTYVCKQCAFTLNKFDKFRQKAIESDQQFRMIKMNLENQVHGNKSDGNGNGNDDDDDDDGLLVDTSCRSFGKPLSKLSVLPSQLNFGNDESQPGPSEESTKITTADDIDYNYDFKGQDKKLLDYHPALNKKRPEKRSNLHFLLDDTNDDPENQIAHGTSGEINESDDVGIPLSNIDSQNGKYQCEDCDKMFSSKSNLNQHSKIHTGERPFSCESCEATFARNTCLKRHKKTHIDKNFFKVIIENQVHGNKSEKLLGKDQIQNIDHDVQRDVLDETTRMLHDNMQKMTNEILKKPKLNLIGTKDSKVTTSKNTEVNKLPTNNIMDKNNGLYGIPLENQIQTTVEIHHETIQDNNLIGFKKTNALESKLSGQRTPDDFIKKILSQDDGNDDDDDNDDDDGLLVDTSCRSFGKPLSKLSVLPIQLNFGNDESQPGPSEESTKITTADDIDYNYDFKGQDKKLLDYHPALNKKRPEKRSNLHFLLDDTNDDPENQIAHGTSGEIKESDDVGIPLSNIDSQNGKYQCEDCDKMFSSKSNLNQHSKIHTGERPFSCESCEATFARNTCLKRHKKTHIDKNFFKVFID